MVYAIKKKIKKKLERTDSTVHDDPFSGQATLTFYLSCNSKYSIHYIDIPVSVFFVPRVFFKNV
jgi:hypothetical protein